MSHSVENDLTIEEIIRLCLLYRAKKGLATTRTGVVKSLYELKRSLPEDNSIKDKLAYYWFKAGPFSENVVAALDKMISTNIISKSPNHDYELYTLNPEYAGRRLVDHDAGMVQVREILHKIIDSMRPFSIDSEIKSQYENDAPSKFYPNFKLEFLRELNLYYNRLEFATDQKNRKTLLEKQENLGKLILDSTGSLPFDSLFSDFKRVYFEFETAFTRLLKINPKSVTNEHIQLIKESLELGTKIWDSFAYGARIMKHDAAYNERIADWKKDFAEHVQTLAPEIDRFYNAVSKIVKSKDYDEKCLSLSEFVKDIMATRQNAEITFINFQTIPDENVISSIVDDRIKQIPEYGVFIREGQLDWTVIKELDDKQLSDIIDNCVKSNTIYVAFSEKDKGTKTRTYRIEANSLSSVMPAAIL